MNAVSAEELLTEQDLERVHAAIRAAEQRTSGEIRVHLDDVIVDDVMDHAAFVFQELAMHRTRERNAVLIFINVAQRRAAVIGDVGIHARLPKGYWNVKAYNPRARHRHLHRHHQGQHQGHVLRVGPGPW